MGLFQITFILSGVLITSILSGVLGMVGDVLLLFILGSQLLPIQQTLLLYATSLFFACAGRAFIHRQHLYLKSIEYYMVGLLFVFIFGSMPGLSLDKLAQDVLLGVAYLLLGIAFFVPFLSRHKVQFDFSQPPQALICAIVVNSITSIDNVLNLFFQDIPMTRYQVISTKAAAMLIPYVIVLAHAGSGVLSAPQLPQELIWVCAAIIPIALLGSYLANHVLSRITDVQFYKATRIILRLMGATYLGKAALLFTDLAPQIMALK